MAPKVPPSGVWCPSITLFHPTEDTLCLSNQAKYYAYLSSPALNLAGLVILGTNAETFLLTREERLQLLTLARASVPAGFPIMAGVSGHSTRQVLEFISDAATAGADYALVLPPAYFGKPATSPAVINGFFDEVATRSPLPVVIYNFPGVCNGIDLDSATIAALVRKHENIVGVKLTCGSVAKITRLAAEFPPERFAVFGGQSDFLLGGLAVGSAGCIAAFANVFPGLIADVYRIYTGFRDGAFADVQGWDKKKADDVVLQLHQALALAEQACKAGGIAAIKYAASRAIPAQAGISAEDRQNMFQPRRPYLPLSKAQKTEIREALSVFLDPDLPSEYKVAQLMGKEVDPITALNRLYERTTALKTSSKLRGL
ncbi:putative 4-hydroxy-2-oxoglutarate aldolase [Rhypophila decipiens]